mmetsp:Transcript_19134/g.34701  ORF Transcript_19134/g.34701 Transcript_19134/m.34701 type:complete len:144 (+) Transcript_19134:112-543(+)
MSDDLFLYYHVPKSESSHVATKACRKSKNDPVGSGRENRIEVNAKSIQNQEIKKGVPETTCKGTPQILGMKGSGCGPYHIGNRKEDVAHVQIGQFETKAKLDKCFLFLWRWHCFEIEEWHECKVPNAKRNGSCTERNKSQGFV